MRVCTCCRMRYGSSSLFLCGCFLLFSDVCLYCCFVRKKEYIWVTPLAKFNFFGISVGDRYLVRGPNEQALLKNGMVGTPPSRPEPCPRVDSFLLKPHFFGRDPQIDRPLCHIIIMFICLVAGGRPPFASEAWTRPQTFAYRVGTRASLSLEGTRGGGRSNPQLFSKFSSL